MELKETEKKCLELLMKWGGDRVVAYKECFAAPIVSVRRSTSATPKELAQISF